MEENTNALVDTEFDVDLSDVFEAEDEGNQTEEPEAETEEREPAAQEEPTQEPAASDKDGKPEAAPELFELKYNKGVQKVTREQMTELAQKGLNHDRILQQRDGLQQALNQQTQWRRQNEAILSELEAVAKASNMDVNGFLNNMRINMLVQQGVKRDVAQERVLREQAERRVQASQNVQQQAQNRQAQIRARQEQDVQEFRRTYPDLDPKTIPQSVWAEVRAGNTLMNAYGRYQSQQQAAEINRLREQIKALEQNNTNKSKAIGSVKTSGASKVQDDFLAGFDSV